MLNRGVGVGGGLGKIIRVARVFEQFRKAAENYALIVSPGCSSVIFATSVPGRR